MAFTRYDWQLLFELSLRCCRVGSNVWKIIFVSMRGADFRINTPSSTSSGCIMAADSRLGVPVEMALEQVFPDLPKGTFHLTRDNPSFVPPFTIFCVKPGYPACYISPPTSMFEPQPSSPHITCGARWRPFFLHSQCLLSSLLMYVRPRPLIVTY